MISSPDNKYFDTESDQTFNLLNNTTVPILNYKRNFVINSRYDYPSDSPSLSDLGFND